MAHRPQHTKHSLTRDATGGLAMLLGVMLAGCGAYAGAAQVLPHSAASHSTNTATATWSPPCTGAVGVLSPPSVLAGSGATAIAQQPPTQLDGLQPGQHLPGLVAATVTPSPDGAIAEVGEGVVAASGSSLDPSGPSVGNAPDRLLAASEMVFTFGAVSGADTFITDQMTDFEMMASQRASASSAAVAATIPTTAIATIAAGDQAIAEVTSAPSTALGEPDRITVDVRVGAVVLQLGFVGGHGLGVSEITGAVEGATSQLQSTCSSSLSSPSPSSSPTASGSPTARPSPSIVASPAPSPTVTASPSASPTP